MAREKLSIKAVIVESWSELLRHRQALFQALILPAVIQIALLYAMMALTTPKSFHLGTMPLMLVYVVTTALFAVSCHRIVLLGPASLPNRWGLYATGNIARYFGYEVLLVVIGAALGLAIRMIGSFAMLVDERVTLTIERSLWLAHLLEGLLIAAALYVFCRLCMVLPATAIERRMGIEAAWISTAGQGWRLVIAVVLTALPLVLLSWLLEWLIGPDPAQILAIASLLVTTLIGAVIVISLSCAYRQLQRIEAETATHAA